jgi:hypothetical protein
MVAPNGENWLLKSPQPASSMVKRDKAWNKVPSSAVKGGTKGNNTG